MEKSFSKTGISYNARLKIAKGNTRNKLYPQESNKERKEKNVQKFKLLHQSVTGALLVTLAPSSKVTVTDVSKGGC